MNAKLEFLFLFTLLTFNFSNIVVAQAALPPRDKEMLENIAAISKDFEGSYLTEKEYNQLARINKKYQLNPEEKKLQKSYKDTLNIISKFKLARTYRKEYMLTKKVEKFRKKKVESIQSPETLKRMRESEKRTKARYKKRKWEARKRKFLNLFK